MRVCFALAIVLAVICGCAAQGWPWTICSDANAVLSVANIDIEPVLLLPGSTVTATITGTMSQAAATGGVAKVDARIDGIPVSEVTSPFPPLPAGPVSIPFGPIPLNSKTRDKKVDFKVYMTSNEGAEVTCFQFFVKVK